LIEEIFSGEIEK